jgi:hypothetical protein
VGRGAVYMALGRSLVFLLAMLYKHVAPLALRHRNLITETDTLVVANSYFALAPCEQDGALNVIGLDSRVPSTLAECVT